MANNTSKKREARLSFKIFLSQFIILYDYKLTWGVFFALSGKFCDAVFRNKLKRFFREYFRLNVKPLLKEFGISEFSICLISKKGYHLENIKDAKLEIKKGLDKLAETIRYKNK